MTDTRPVYLDPNIVTLRMAGRHIDQRFAIAETDLEVAGVMVAE